MALRITDITLRDFRSYEAEAFNGLGQLVVLVGPNAVGKTNAIEAVQLLTALTTFRHAPAAQLLRHGQSAARLSCSATDGNRLIEVSLSIGETRRYQLNGKAKRPADLKGLLPSVTFTPDDLDLVKGPQGNRRRALDALGAQLNKNYYLIRKDYDKVLRHKNRLLKEQASEALLESIDEMVVRVGAQLTCYRAALFEKLAAAMVRAYQRISHGAEELRPWFAPSWLAEGSGAGEAFPSANALSPGGASAVGRAPAAATGFAPPFTREEAAEALYRQVATRRPEERARGRALVGPQADAIGFELDGLAAGQQPRPDLGAFRVEHDCDVQSKFLGNSADALHARFVVGMVSVAEVETSDIHAGFHQLAQNVVVFCGGAHGAHDFRALLLASVGIEDVFS